MFGFDRQVAVFLVLDPRKVSPTMWNVSIINWDFFFFLMLFMLKCVFLKKLKKDDDGVRKVVGKKRIELKRVKFYSTTVVKSNNSVWWREGV